MSATRLPSPRRRRPASRGRSRAATMLVALAAIGVLFGLAALGLTAQRGLPLTDYYELTAEFRDAANLKRGSEVRSAGRRIGQVAGVSRAGGRARVQLQLAGDTRPLRSGTTARIRLKGLLGAHFVDLTAGRHGPALADGAMIPVARTSTTVDLPDVLQSLDRRRRARLGATVRGLGYGFAGRGSDVNDAIGNSPTVLRDLAGVARAVNRREGAAQRLFPSLASAAEAFSPVRGEIAGGFDPTARSLAPFADRRRALQGALEQAPPALAGLRSALVRTDPLLREVARFARASRHLTRPAPAALRGTTALMRDGNRPLRDTRPVLTRLGRSVPRLNRLADRVDPLIRPSIRNVRTADPLLAQIARRRCDLLAYSRNWRSMFAFGSKTNDPLGPETAWRLELVKTGTTASAPLPFESRYTEPKAGCVTPEPVR